FLLTPSTPRATLFPYTTLFRSECSKPADNPWIDQPVMTIERVGHGAGRRDFPEQPNILRLFVGAAFESDGTTVGGARDQVWILEDRKSTRLNSSHDQISYAVFC